MNILEEFVFGCLLGAYIQYLRQQDSQLKRIASIVQQTGRRCRRVKCKYWCRCFSVLLLWLEYSPKTVHIVSHRSRTAYKPLLPCSRRDVHVVGKAPGYKTEDLTHLLACSPALTSTGVVLKRTTESTGPFLPFSWQTDDHQPAAAARHYRYQHNIQTPHFGDMAQFMGSFGVIPCHM
jgi:hypothetical protein